jgi:hypothetical protein
MVDQYTRLCYRLWEDSWADHAVVNGKQRGIGHKGEYYRVHGLRRRER